jgi:carbonic anhydrase
MIARTLQYAGQHLQTLLFVVLGHEQCGAVQAALDVKFRGGKEKDRIQLLLANILPGLEGIDEQSTPENSRAVNDVSCWRPLDYEQP